MSTKQWDGDALLTNPDGTTVFGVRLAPAGQAAKPALSPPTEPTTTKREAAGKVEEEEERYPPVTLDHREVERKFDPSDISVASTLDNRDAAFAARLRAAGAGAGRPSIVAEAYATGEDIATYREQEQGSSATAQPQVAPKADDWLERARAQDAALKARLNKQDGFESV